MTWSDRVNWYDIPEHMRGGVRRYVEKGLAPGHFLKAVICNDLMEAVRRGDDENQKLLASYAKLLANQCPSHCYGDDETYDRWIARGGIEGNDTHEPLPTREWSRWADQDYR